MEENSFNNTITIEGDQITPEHIQKCIVAFKVILNNTNIKPELIIEAEDAIKGVDFSIFGHFMLFSTEYARKHKRNIDIKLILKNNYPEPTDEDDNSAPASRSITWKIRQHMVHAYYSIGMKSVFSIVDGNGEFSEAETKKNDWFVLSEKFLPITYLNKYNYEKLFETKLEPFELNDINGLGKYENTFYQSIRRHLFKKKNSKNYLSVLSQLAFCRCLQQAKVLRYYLYDKLDENTRKKLKFPDNKDNFQVSYVQNKKTKEKYREVVLNVFGELESKPPIYHLVFFSLISKFDDTITNDCINTKNIEDSIQIEMLRLWNFSKEFVYGLNELAKNIVQHSSEKEGVISGFVNINDELEIKIFDHGKVSILETFKKDNENQIKRIKQRKKNSNDISVGIDKKLLEIYEVDDEILKNNVFQLKHFFETQDEVILNQQAKRATAHIGLLFFKRLIENNNGQFVVVSHNDSYRSPETSPINTIYSIGTCFKAILSLKKGAEYDPVVNISQPKLSQKDNVENLNLLLKYNFIEIEDDKTHDLNSLKNVLLNYRLESVINSEKNKEKLFSLFLKKTHAKLGDIGIEQLQNKQDLVFAFDFEDNNKLNGSQILRFLGLIYLLFPRTSIIFYNIKIELFFELTLVNKALYKSASLPFWNADVFLIAYCYIENSNIDESNQSAKIATTNRFYFTDVLWGENPDQFHYVSKIIRKNNYNAVFELTKSLEDDFKNKGKILSYELPDNMLFFNRSSLLPFDLIVKNKKKECLFELNSKYLLNKEIDNRDIEKKPDPKAQSETLVKNLDELPGFKISGSHYRLGSKIHLKDFFYAKRYFQNSFFASRFAFIVTEFLLKSLNSKNERQFPDEQLRNLTFLGYGIYSELLLSLVEKLLKESLSGEVKINHNIVNDSESMAVIKDIEYERPNRNVIIIVPIASTFSTSLKMDEYFNKYIETYNSKLKIKANQDHSEKTKEIDVVIMQPHINLILVSDEDISIKEKPNDIELKHGWKSFNHNLKNVTVLSFYTQKNTEQKYFLSLPSKWYSQDECIRCFPNFDKCNDKKVETHKCLDVDRTVDCLLCEKPLHYTDKTSVTPEELFGFPEAKSIDNTNNFKISTESLIYSHSQRNNDCFQYHIIDEKFFQINYTQIENWLKEVREIIYPKKKHGEDEADYVISETDSVLLFAPEHYSNTVFINKVNEIVFLNSATILHYDVWVNNVSNFKTFYKELITEYDKIFFIDDTVITGGTIQKASDIIKYTKLEIAKDKEKKRIKKKQSDNDTTEKDDTIKQGEWDEHVFDGCFFLINRTTKHTNEIISNFAGNKDFYFSFANIHLPNAKAYGTKCQQCADLAKFEYLFSNSQLDRLKNHFFSRVLKLKPRATTEKTPKSKESPSYNKNQNLIKIELTHRLFDYFKEDGENRVVNIKQFVNLNFPEWFDYFIKNSEAPFKVIDVKTSHQIQPLSEEACVLLKVMALHPFIIHKPIKDRIFNWTNWLLNEYIGTIESDSNSLSIEQFRDIKFLIRRAGLLKSNYIISARFLAFIIKFFKNENLSKLLKNNKEERDILQEGIDQYKPSQPEQAEATVSNLFENHEERERKKEKEAKHKNNLDKLKEVFENIKAIENFSTYFIAQIKEMLYKNEARSIVIEQRVVPLYENETFPESKQLLRRILEENGALINSFWEQARKELISVGIEINEKGIIEFNGELDKDDKANKKNESDALKIIRKRKNIFSELETFLNTSSNEEKHDDKTKNLTAIDKDLLSYLRIQTGLAVDSDKENNNESEFKKLSLNEKTHALCKSIEQLFSDEDADTKLGTFFIVKYKEHKAEQEKAEQESALDNNDNQQAKDLTKFMFTAYNEGYAKDAVDDCLYEKDNFIARFIDGITNKRIKNEHETPDAYKIEYNATIDVIKKLTDNKEQFKVWVSDYAIPDVEEIKIDFLKDKDDVKYVLILRFSEKTIKEEDETLKKDPLGAIVIYSNKNIFTYQKNRYLLLLRQSISNFLSKHHKNDEFRDWYEIIEKSNFIKSFSHGVTTYERTIKSSISNLYKLFNKSNLPTETLEILNILFLLIHNKKIIIKFITDFKSGFTLKEAIQENKITEIPYSVEMIKTKLEDMLKYIFNCVHPIYYQIPENYYKLNFHISDDINELKLYNKILDDIIFEVFFNIRKVYYRKLQRNITIENPIIITVSLSKTSICFKNSFFSYLDYPPNIPNLQRKIKRNDLSKGLNVINSISKILYNKECSIDANDDIFLIKIPIK